MDRCGLKVCVVMEVHWIEPLRRSTELMVQILRRFERYWRDMKKGLYTGSRISSSSSQSLCCCQDAAKGRRFRHGRVGLESSQKHPRCRLTPTLSETGLPHCIRCFIIWDQFSSVPTPEIQISAMTTAYYFSSALEALWDAQKLGELEYSPA